MRLRKDCYRDLVSDEKGICYDEFRKRNWGFYYYSSTFDIIKLHREKHDNNTTLYRYWL